MSVQPDPSQSSEQVGPSDPEHDLTATYALDPAYGRAPTNRVVSTSGHTVATYSPMGGMRESGMGRRQGSEGILRYTESQSVAVQKLIRFAPMFGMSDKTYAKVMIANLRLMKKLGRA